MKLSEWAKQKGICYKTAWRYFKAGKIAGAYQTHTGLIVIPISTDESNSKTVVYARVSSSEPKEDLKRQVERFISFLQDLA